MVTFWKIASHSVYHMLSLLYLYVVFVGSHLGFEGGNLVLIAPWPLLSFYFLYILIIGVILFTYITFSFSSVVYLKHIREQ